jgi:pyridoxine 5'-phosphate synthase PdxJ
MMPKPVAPTGGNGDEGCAMAKKEEELDEETLAFVNWCIEVEGFLVAGGATVRQAQDHIEEEIEWFTDQFYDSLTPEEAAKEALA